MTVTAQASASAGAPLPAFVVERPVLVERLERATRKRVVLVVAPAGYGKSVLLAQWHAAHPERRVAWLSVRPTDDAVQLGRRLVGALTLTPVAARRAVGLIRPDGAVLGEDFLDVVQAELEEAAPVLVVIEDLEMLASPILLDELGLLAERAGDGVGFVFVGRDDRLPHTPRLRLRDEVAEIRQDALALSRTEAGEAVERVAGRLLHPVQVEALHTRTEGWAAGIQLAALSLRDHTDPDRFVADFAGDDRHVADYLSGEVLALQPPEVTDFLVRVAVLDRLCGGLCDAVTGGADGQRMLERLDQQSLFIRPLDDRREWFAYHPLFRDLLRYELRATRPGEERSLLERAAAWHLQQGYVDEAAEYLLRAGDWSGVIALAKAQAGRYFERGEAPTVLRWLGKVPFDVLAEDLDAVITKATLHTMCGSALSAQELLDRIEGGAVLTDWRQSEVKTIRASWISYHASPDESEAAADVALGLLDRGFDRAGEPLLDVLTPAAMRSIAMVAKGMARSMRAEFGLARPFLVEVAEGSGPLIWAIHAMGELAWVEASTGNLRAALTVGRRALAAAHEVDLGHHAATAGVHLALARALRERSDSAAAIHLDAGLARARLNQRARVIALAWGELAHAALVDGRVTEGLEVIARARVSGGPPISPATQARLVSLEVRLHLALGNTASARVALDEHDGVYTSVVAAAAAALAAAVDDEAALRKIVEDWLVADTDEPWARWSCDLWTAVLLDLEGDRRSAIAQLREVVTSAEAEGAVRLFLDSGPDVLRLVRSLYHDDPTPFLRRLVEQVAPISHRGSSDLVEQLTERELLVLQYLPSRLSNADIAARLYVSVNTLKTHLKNIYRKLAVGDRSEAIERAEELGLL
jgi:LuxR family maltose regulon positive regulatory protein